MKKIITIVSFIVLSANVQAKSKCKITFKKFDYCADVQFLETPSRSKSSDFKLVFYDKKNKVVMPKETIYSYNWMVMKSGHEHGSDRFQITKKKDHYMIKNVWFTMLGNWQLWIVIKSVDGKNVLDKNSTKVCIAPKGKSC